MNNGLDLFLWRRKGRYRDVVQEMRLLFVQWRSHPETREERGWKTFWYLGRRSASLVEYSFTQPHPARSEGLCEHYFGASSVAYSKPLPKTNILSAIRCKVCQIMSCAPLSPRQNFRAQNSYPLHQRNSTWHYIAWMQEWLVRYANH